MRKIIRISPIIVFLLITIQTIKAQNIILSESFDSSTYPPNGWTFDNPQASWSYSNTTDAGGNSGESVLGGFINGTSRFISPVVDLSNKSNVSLEFRQSVVYGGQGTDKIGVATRSGNGNWSSIWEVNLTGAINAQMINVAVNNSDSNASDFQFCFYFTGNSVILWHIDDIKLYSSINHDISTVGVLGKSVFGTNASYQPMAVVKNTGLNTESFNVICKILDKNDVQLYTDTQTVSNLQTGNTNTITFSNYTLANPNALYKVIVSSNLGNDQNNSNDTLLKNVYTYTTNRNKVLLEIGTGTWCGLCPGAAMAADQLIANGKDVAIVEYHHSNNNNDDFTTPTGDSRISYYDITGYPTAFFDGTVKYPGGSPSSIYSDYLPLYEQQISVKTGVNIDLSETHTNNNFTITIDLKKVGPIADTNNVLFLTLTESDINYSWQGLSKLDFVQRLTLPNAEGRSVDLVNNDSLSIPFTFQVDNTWTNELEVIAFIQNKETKEILNCAKLSLANPVGIEHINKEANNLIIYPNPASDWIIIKSTDNMPKNILIKDLTGKVVKQIKGIRKQERINVSGIARGIYFIELISSSKKTEIHKLILK